MDRFLSSFTNRLDAKGRVSIPASFRAVLTRDGFEGLFVTPSLDADALDCGGNALLREIAELIERQPPQGDFGHQRVAGMRRIEGPAEQADLHAFRGEGHTQIAGWEAIGAHSAGHWPSGQSRAPWMTCSTCKVLSLYE